MNKPQKINSKSVLILGAGVAGLAAGYELSCAGFKVTVLEKENHVGGLASTLRKGNFRFDTGPHRWYTKNDETNRWLLTFMKSEIIKVPRLTRIYFDKKFFYYPIKLGVITALPIWQTILAGFDYLLVLARQITAKRKPVSLEDGYINKFGSTLYEIFFKRYSEKLWGRSCSQISSDWIDQRTRGFNALTVISELLFKSKKTVSFVDEFFYPKFGIGSISEKLKSAIEMNGGKIVLEANVRKINRSKDKITSITASVGKKQSIFKASEFISTIPLPYLISQISPSASTDVLRAAKKLRFRSEVQVTLFLAKGKITRDSWIYVHPFELCFVRMMEMDNWSPKMQSNGSTAYILEVPCEFNDKTWNMKDDEIVEKVIKEFTGEFDFVRRDEILGSYVHRIENLLPVYHIGYLKPLNTIKKYLKNFSNLQIAGRNGIFRYNNTDHSIEMGFYAARNIIFGDKSAYDIESINAGSEYLEEKKINNPNGENFEDRQIEENRK